ncbi:hypothetical protein [Streptomyces aureus]|uniref:hypothetical protein n=1 Tax=Streptomyces aureus TaxID=193461 RepID=UPI00056BD2A2|nr:hypothetical protein [Streptomyces aureus]
MPKQGHGRELPEGFEEFRADGNRRCWSRSKKSNGEQCGAPAMLGQNICHHHGGSAPQSIRAAKERLSEERARKLVATYGRKIETTATEALLDEVQWTAGHVAWLRERVQEIEEGAVADGTDGAHPLVWGVTREKTGGEDHGVTSEASPNVWLKLYQQERTHLVKVCEAAIRAGIEERRVRLAEEQGALVAQVIRLILADLDLTAEQRQRVPEIVPRHLRALGS